MNVYAAIIGIILEMVVMMPNLLSLMLFEKKILSILFIAEDNQGLY